MSVAINNDSQAKPTSTKLSAAKPHEVPVELQGRSSRWPDQIFGAETSEFQESLNRSSFLFEHNLAHHPMFDLPQLTEVAKYLWSKADGRVTFHTADKPIGEKWEMIPRKAQSLISAINRIQESDSWILLKSVHEVPEYDSLLQQCIDELEVRTRTPLRKLITWLEAYIFIASPHSITPFHIDHEATFLFQIHGEKDNNLFDPYDRSVISNEELERYYVGDLSAASYTAEKQPKATVYRMAPGNGVHHPIRAPHWVKNGDRFSVSLNVNFCLKPFDQEAKVYQSNHYLRKLGLKPTPPGKSAWRDSLKQFVLSDMGHKHRTKDEMIRFGYRKYGKPLELIRRVSGKSQVNG